MKREWPLGMSGGYQGNAGTRDLVGQEGGGTRAIVGQGPWKPRAL